MAVALRWRDPERYRDDFIAILLSHGIGMGLVLKGELFTGTHSSGGEFGGAGQPTIDEKISEFERTGKFNEARELKIQKGLGIG